MKLLTIDSIAPYCFLYLSRDFSIDTSNSSNSRRGGRANNGNKGSNRKDVKKVVHSDAPIKEAPDPRWAGELSKLKDLLANQKTPV